ncbi:ABC transporter ATP-binding protein [Nocardioides sp. LHD-245]|uniref:ABC transporter ATP-binding protein n=1 Tax=Nocardioides sp. LHD-245 TaxID=3051387 RepID=UPI0027E1824F|nr:ABC transporter ATP-binding protein [Nocardioides sp. LHD-245]
MALLEVAGLHAGYGALQVLHEVDLTVDDGDITVILGANGAGKTTLLRALSGMLPARGSVTYDGTELLGRRRNPARMGIAHVPQGRGTFGTLTVEENLRVAGYHRPAREVESSIRRWQEFFPRLGERADQPAAGLSGGEQQMLAIARALMSAPRLLLLDEPSLGLAPKTTRGLFEGLKRINDETGLTMLLVEQNARLTLAIADHAIVISAGRTGEKRPAAQMWQDETIQRAYLGD